MAWTTPVDQTTGHLVTAVEYNAQIIDNLKYLHGDGGATIDVSAGGQLLLTNSVSSGPTAASALSGSGPSGVIATSTGLTILRTTVGVLFAVGSTADTVGRMTIDKAGTVQFGTGSAATDTTLQRQDVGVLTVGNVKRAVIGTLAYSASITPDCRTAEWQTITVTNGTAFTINAPSNPPSAGVTQDLTLEIFNNSGGVMGAITWDAAYTPKSGGQPINFVNPANTKKRAVFLRWNGANWIVVNSTSSDY